MLEGREDKSDEVVATPKKNLEKMKKDVGLVRRKGKETDAKVETLIEAKLAEGSWTEVEDKVKGMKEDVEEKMEVERRTI